MSHEMENMEKKLEKVGKKRKQEKKSKLYVLREKNGNEEEKRIQTCLV